MSDPEITTLLSERDALTARIAAIDTRLGILQYKNRNGVHRSESIESKLALAEQIITELKQEKRW